MKKIMTRTAALIVTFMLVFGSTSNTLYSVYAAAKGTFKNELLQIQNDGRPEENTENTTEPPPVVAPPKATKITLSPDKTTITVGQTVQLSVAQEPADSVAESVTYSSSNDSISTVNSTGLVSGVKAGNVTITAKSTSGLASTSMIKVQAAPKVSRISFLPSDITIKEKDSLQLTVVQEPANAIKETITYTSNNNSIVAVGANTGHIIAMKPGSTNITATASSGLKAICTVTVQADGNKITGIRFSPDKITVSAGSTQQLNVIQEPTGAVKETITYSTSNSNIATVNSNGIVSGVRIGTATITAKSSSGYTDTCVVTVQAASKITRIYFSPSNISLKVGETNMLNIKQEPSNATADTITYTTSNSNIVTVSTTGRATAIREGTARITAKSSSGLIATCDITVKENSKITQIYFWPNDVTIKAGENTRLTVKQEPSYETPEKITYTSSNNGVVTVNSSGRITGIRAGSARITAKSASGLNDTCRVTVEAKVELSKTKLSLDYGEKSRLKIKGTDDYVTWRSSDRTIATVDDGRVTGVSPGTATVSARVDGENYSCSVRVRRPSIDKRKKNMKIGQSFYLSVNNNSKNVKWTSSNSQVASVSRYGNVKAKRPGKTTITARIDRNYSFKCTITVSKSSVKPSFSVRMTSNTDQDCILVAMKITNNGSSPIKILSKDASLVDHDYKSFNRDLYLANVNADEDFRHLSYVTIQPDQSKYIRFVVDGESTWYDSETYICYNVEYNGKRYYYRSSYEKGTVPLNL